MKRLRAAYCISIAAAVSFFIGCTHSSSRRDPAQTYVVQNPETDLTYQQLVTILEQKRFSKIDDLLKHIGSSNSDYMSRYTLAFASKSLHESTKRSPRAIVYGKTANLVITFNGERNQGGYEMLEVMNFNDQTKTFEFREIEFNENGQLQQPYKISSNGGPEGKCLQCHTNSKPIFNYYPIWPGFYGGDDDMPVTAFTPRSGSDNSFRLPIPDSVKSEWAQWKADRPTRDRYMHLKEMYGSDREYSGARPNSDFTIMLMPKNFQRISRILKDANIASAKPAVLYAIYCDKYVTDSTYFNEMFQTWRARADREAFGFQAMNFYQLIPEMGLEWTVVRDSILERTIAQQHHRLDKDVIPRSQIVAELSANEFGPWVQKLVTSEAYRELRSGGQFSLQLSVLDRYFPQTQVKTWPMNMHDGIYRFDSGIEVEDEFNKAIFAALYTDPRSPEAVAERRVMIDARRAEYARERAIKYPDDGDPPVPPSELKARCADLDRQAARVSARSAIQ